MVQNIIEYAMGMSNELGIMFLSMIPITELRAAIPIFIAKGMDPFMAFIMAIVGNILPVPFILLLASPIFKWMRKRKCFAKIVSVLDRKVEKNTDKITKYEFWGLVLFVAIPLPGTGAWTGSFVASILNLNFRKAMLSIVIGVIIAGVIITLLSTGVFTGIKLIF